MIVRSDSAVRSSTIRRRGLRYFLAMALGASVPFLAGVASLPHGTANATAHCTDYAPTNIIDPSNCSQTHSVSSGAIYQTSSTAIRDANHISASSNQYLEIDYLEEPSGTIDGVANDYASSLSVGGSSGQAYAECSFDVSTTGNCHTNWRS